MHPDDHPAAGGITRLIRPRGTRRVLSLMTATVLAAAALLSVSASSADADGAAHPNSITSCTIDGVQHLEIFLTPENTNTPGNTVDVEYVFQGTPSAVNQIYYWYEDISGANFTFVPKNTLTGTVTETDPYYYEDIYAGEILLYTYSAISADFNPANINTWNSGPVGDPLCSITFVYANLDGSDPRPAPPAAYEHSITSCNFLNFINSPITELSVPFDGVTFQQLVEGVVEDDGPDAGMLWIWFRQTLNGDELTQGPGLTPPVGSIVTVPGVGVPGSDFVANDVFVIEVWAVSGINPLLNALSQTGAARVGDADSPLCTLTLTFLPMPNFGGGGGGGTPSAGPSWIATDGAAPQLAPGAGVWQRADGSLEPLAVTRAGTNQLRYSADGVRVTLTGGPGTDPSRGLVADANGEIVCEVCALLAPGEVIEAWMFSDPRLVAAWRIADLPCQQFTIPVGAPMDGAGPLPAGAHTLQLALPTASGMQAVNVGVTVGGIVPTRIPAGEGRGVPAGALAVFAGVVLVVGVALRREAVGRVG